MTQYLPPNLLAHFAPRNPIPFLPPPDKLPHQKKTFGYSGVADFLQHFEDPAETPPPVRIETREERQERRRKEKAEYVAYKLELEIAKWNPRNNPSATSDPYKTLFVARINYNTSEAKIRREFEQYGDIKNVIMVHDEPSGKPRGYAFIEYESGRDMHTAYKRADGRKIDGRRVLVDMERGRTIKGWLPRRLGGGLGGTRRGGPEINVKHSGREEPRGEERHVEHERERPERPERRRSRSRSRERRHRSRSRERRRGDRSDRYKRERSKERDRGRDREPVLGGDKLEMADENKGDMPPDNERKERRRSRSRDRERRRRRSRSRERSKWHDRDRDGRRHERGEREDRMKEERMAVDNVPMDAMNPQNGFNNPGY